MYCVWGAEQLVHGHTWGSVISIFPPLPSPSFTSPISPSNHFQHSSLIPSFYHRPKGMRERKTDLETERQVFEHRLRDEEERYLLRKEEEDPLKEWVR